MLSSKQRGCCNSTPCVVGGSSGGCTLGTTAGKRVTCTRNEYEAACRGWGAPAVLVPHQLCIPPSAAQPTCNGAMVTANAPSGRLWGCSSAMFSAPSSEGRTRERPSLSTHKCGLGLPGEPGLVRNNQGRHTRHSRRVCIYHGSTWPFGCHTNLSSSPDTSAYGLKPVGHNMPWRGPGPPLVGHFASFRDIPLLGCTCRAYMRFGQAVIPVLEVFPQQRYGVPQGAFNAGTCVSSPIINAVTV